jgi:hypothetical protein
MAAGQNSERPGTHSAVNCEETALPMIAMTVCAIIVNREKPAGLSGL